MDIKMENKLNVEQYAMLFDALQAVYMVDAGDSCRDGEHVLLMFALRQVGVSVSNSMDAVRIAEELVNAY